MVNEEDRVWDIVNQSVNQFRHSQPLREFTVIRVIRIAEDKEEESSEEDDEELIKKFKELDHGDKLAALNAVK